MVSYGCLELSLAKQPVLVLGYAALDSFQQSSRIASRLRCLKYTSSMSLQLGLMLAASCAPLSLSEQQSLLSKGPGPKAVTAWLLGTKCSNTAAATAT